MRKSIIYLWQCRDYVLRFITPFIFSPLLFLSDTPEAKCAYGVCIIMTFWLFEAMPLAVTALLPLVIFPLLGVLSSAIAAKAFINSTLMVFLGSMIAATAVEKSNLHMRIALKVILFSGTSVQRFLLGFMMTTAVMSFCISNIATMALMLPVINAAFEQLTKPLILTVNDDDMLNVLVHNHNKPSTSGDMKRRKYSFLSNREISRLRKGILLGNCYASVIGGTATLTGNPTNLMLNVFIPENPVSYSDWFLFNFPGVMLMVLLTWVFFCMFFVNHETNNTPTKEQEEQIYDLIRLQYNKLGRIRFHEVAVFILFVLMIVLWFLRAPDFMPGWTLLFTSDKTIIDDQVPAILIVILLFLIPRDPTHLNGSPALLEWRDVQERVGWGIILLLGGGFSMAKACEDSGLSFWIADKLMILSELPLWLTLTILCVVAMILTELTSNVSTGTIILPVVKQIALSMNIAPLSLMLPLTLCSNYGFMLPVASAMTAMVYETGHMKITDMLVPGIFVKLICFCVHFITLKTWGSYVFNDFETINPLIVVDSFNSTTILVE